MQAAPFPAQCSQAPCNRPERQLEMPPAQTMADNLGLANCMNFKASCADLKATTCSWTIKAGYTAKLSMTQVHAEVLYIDHHCAHSCLALQLGSQYRGKAEPAGAIVDGKWVPKADGQTTLNEQPPGPMCRDLTDPPKPPEQPAAKK